ncbi:MAG: tRNA 2-selenouridine(34) synthase MnmH [Nodosilinea sp.]
MPTLLTIDEFLRCPGPILDVRSPAEYEHGHIPGATSFPLFSNDERAQVGTCYKQVGREAAVELGFELAGPKCALFIRQAKALAPDRHLRLHCWRGGMRSGGMGWILDLAGFTVSTLEGGYKAYRQRVRQILATPKPLVVLGGMTGTSKTLILQQLAALGQPVLDLEGLAHHRGSSFGALLLPPQPTTEHYENLIAQQWARFSGDQPIWIEAESRRVGTCRIPDELFNQMVNAPTLEVTRSVDERLDLLVSIYGEADLDGLIQATQRIGKRLGGQRTQAAVALIQAGQLREACAIILDYYDRTYRYDLERRDQSIPQVDITGLEPEASARWLLQKRAELYPLVEGSVWAPSPDQALHQNPNFQPQASP